MLVAGGSTNVTTYFAMRLTADGKAATGLTIANVDMQYVRSGAVPVAKVDAVALAATNTAHTDNRGIEIDATDQPGLYRFDWPDAAFVAGVREVILSVKVATAYTEHLRVTIDGEVNVVEWAGTDVVAGAIPAAAANAAGGLATSAGGATGIDDLATPTNITGGTITTVTTLTGHTAQTGDNFAIVNGAAGLVAIDTVVDGNKVILDAIAATGTGLTAIPWNAAWDAEVQSEVNDALVALDLDHLTKTATGIPAITAGTFLATLNLPDQTMNITGNITGNVSGSVGSVTGAVGSVTGAVGSVTGAVGSVTGAVGSVAGNVDGTVASVVTKTGYALSSTGADLVLKSSTFALAIADAIWDELQAGHVTADSAGLVMNELQDAGRIDALIDAIKLVTDKFVFTVANQVNANTLSINGATVVGDGNATPWDGA